MTWGDSLFNGLFDVLALIFFGVLLCTLWAAAKDPKFAGTGNALLAAVVAVFCAIMGNPERFQKISFSPSGVVAEARQTIQQVQVTLEQLQKLSSALARGSLDELAFSGVIFSGVTPPEKFHVRDQIVERLKDIGLKEDDILEAQRVWIIVYCSIIEGLIEANVVKASPKEDVKYELTQLKKDTGKDGLPFPDALKGWVATKGIADLNTIELLSEYERVWTTGGMKNPALIPFGAQPSAPGQRD